jgi:class 3 adenylate cyclase/tetratricopeptide (TPR) repeat protein
MATDPTVFQSFVPAELVRWVGQHDTVTEEPASEQREMVTWFADLSNFSHLTHEITERERAGPELIGRLLDQVFGTIIDKVSLHGGSVSEFAGDSVLATWDVDPSQGPSLAVARAASCGRDVLGLELPAIYAELPPLELRVGIGAGTGVLMAVGGVDRRWHFFIGGPPVAQMGKASNVARPGEVILSPEAAAVAGGLVEGRIGHGGHLLLTDLHGVETPEPKPAPEITPDLADRLRRFLSPPVLRRIDAGQSEWLAEFRQVTSLFVNLPLLDPSSVTSMDALQDIVAATQTTLQKYEGTLSRIINDDKGITLLATFGLPPFAHEEDAYLAVQAAGEMQAAITEMKLEYGIGITTGRAFCGAYGSPARREYTTLGQEVNLAARLMKSARFEILCDQATVRAARRIEFHPLEPRRLHGWDELVPVFRPLWEKTGALLEPRETTELVGRDSEQLQLTAWLGALVRARSSAVVVVEGEAGIGKSALADHLIHTARAFDVEILKGAAIPVAQATYQAWHNVISQVLGLTEVRSLKRRQELVREHLSTWPQFAEWEALLNSVLDLQFPETASTRGMSGTNRRDSTIELLVAILAETATRSPLLIVLDDVHWFDSASWALTLTAARKVSPMLLILLTRPMSQRPDEMEELSDIGTAARLTLKPLGEEETLRLARETFGARELDADLARVIVEATEGVPFFVEELALSLRDTGAINVERGRVRLNRPADELGVPHSLSSVVLSRIDGLAPQLQLTLKVASVIGRSFDSSVLQAVHPDPPEVDELEGQLADLKALDLIYESSPASFDFRHALTRETAYNLLLFDQRRRIHRSVAHYLETMPDEPGEPMYALLAYHWDRGEDRQKALAYHEKTGASALRKGANREAIDAHTRSLDLVHQHPDDFSDVSRLRQSQWHFEIGQAHEALGNFEEAEKSLYRALELTEVHVPASAMGRVGRLLREVAKQVAHIVLPGAVRTPRDGEERVRLGQAARIAALIGEIYYFTGNISGFPVLNLVAINLGEKSGEPLVAGLAYSSLGYLVGTLRMRRLADRYFRMAREAENLESHDPWTTTSYVLEFEEMGPGHLIAAGLAESVLALTFDEWSRAQEIVTDALERCDRLGDKYSAGIALAVRGFVSYCSGAIEEAHRDYNQLLASARQRANREHEAWATSFVIPVLLAQDRLDEAKEMASAAHAIVEDADTLTVPVIHGTRSQVELRQGRLVEARASAERALETIGGTPIFIYLAGFAGLLDTLLELRAAEGDRDSSDARELSTLSSEGLQKMRRFARVLPFARPKYWLFRGRSEQLRGRTKKARRAFDKGLTLAVRSGFTWDEGLLHLELARALDSDDPALARHLAEAAQSFEKVGSRHDLDRVAVR